MGRTGLDSRHANEHADAQFHTHTHTHAHRHGDAYQHGHPAAWLARLLAHALVHNGEGGDVKRVLVRLC
jgi:hypothetical protein